MSLSDIWWDIDDKLWGILDAIRLGELFEKYNIPPIIFPILIIALILIAIFVMSAPSNELKAVCGDGICSSVGGEDSVTCSVDCPLVPTSNDITIRVRGANDCKVLEFLLMDSLGNRVGDSIRSTEKSVVFEGIPLTEVYAVLSAPSSTKVPVESDKINTAEESVIAISLPNNYCSDEQVKSDDNRPGSITVDVYDSSSGVSMTANVYVYDSGKSKIAEKEFSTSYTFNKIPSNKYYYLTANAAGYGSHEGQDDMIYVGPAKEVKRDIFLTPLVATVDEEATGKLEVCVTGDGESIEHSGELGIFDVADNLIKVGKLTDCPLFRGLATSSGCIIFTLPAGQHYYAAVTRAPSGCTISERKGPILVEQNKKELVSLKLDCSDIGGVRAVVYADDEVITDDCKVELYYINDTKIITMELSDDDKYTEYESLPDNTEVYVYAKNVPEGYLNTLSDVIKIDSGENKTVRIDLDVKPEDYFTECIQPAKLKIGGSGNDAFVYFEISGTVGWSEPEELEYTSTGSGPYAMRNIYVPGVMGEDGPLNEVEGTTVRLKLDSESGVLTASASCNLYCGDDLGDLNNDDEVDDTDEEILSSILDALEILGSSAYDIADEDWPPVCTDINEDGELTEQDLVCLSSDFQQCISCEDAVGDRLNDYEVCADGYDNNCDGQTDADTFDESIGDFYDIDGEDVCTCTDNTPCIMRKDPSGGTAPLDELTALKCRSLSDVNSGDYQWYSPMDLTCTSERSGVAMQCDDTTQYCTYDSGTSTWGWSDDSVIDPYCGDGECNGDETSATCVGDCPIIPPEELPYGNCGGICSCSGITNFDCLGYCSDLQISLDCRRFDSSLAGNTETEGPGTDVSCLAVSPAVVRGYLFRDLGGGKVGIELKCVPIIGASWGTKWTVSSDNNCGTGYVIGIKCDSGDCATSPSYTITCAMVNIPVFEPSCEESGDTGRDYYVYGKTSSIESIGQFLPTTNKDECLDSLTLREWYCDGDSAKYEDYDCPNGCDVDNGVCKEGSIDKYLCGTTGIQTGYNNFVIICGIREGVLAYSGSQCNTGWMMDACGWNSDCDDNGEYYNWQPEGSFYEVGCPRNCPLNCPGRSVKIQTTKDYDRWGYGHDNTITFCYKDSECSINKMTITCPDDWSINPISSQCPSEMCCTYRGTKYCGTDWSQKTWASATTLPFNTLDECLQDL